VSPFYEPAWAYGGMARATSGLAAALARRGHEVTVVTALLDPAHPPEETRAGVRVARLRGPRWLQSRLVPWGRGLGRLLEGAGERFDLAHLHGHRTFLSLQAATRLRAAGVPFVLQPHGTFPHHGRHRLLKTAFDVLGGNRAVHGAAALLAVSEAEARDLPRRAWVVPNGVVVPALAPVVPRKDGMLLFVGSDHPQKGARRLPALLAALEDTSLVLVGRFPPRFASRFGASAPRVSLRGVLDPEALARAYAEASVVVHPSEGEAFGLVPFEAALAGTPAVVAGGHGCAEWFARAGGAVVAGGDVSALVAAVRARLRDRALGRAEADAVAAFCRRELTWDRAAASVETLYREVLASRRRPRA
jgi:glycosyltransferase involved in cell wall biosynthesis